MQIHENRRKDAIPVLEHVVSEELVNPLYHLLFGTKHFEVFLDDNVKSELNKSSIGLHCRTECGVCLVSPG